MPSAMNLSPMPKQPMSAKQKGAAAALAAMLAIATPIYAVWEGEKLLPYKDVIGVWTVCSGDTRNVIPGQAQTREQCRERTKNILIEFGTEVARLSPGIEDSPLEWSAHTIFAANVGMGNYGKSSVRRFYNSGDFRNACRAMRLYDKAGGRVFVGLQNRRGGTPTMLGEYELCLGGAIPRSVAK